MDINSGNSSLWRSMIELDINMLREVRGTIRNVSSSHRTTNPQRLKTLVCNVVFPNGNTLLHQFVVNNSHPNDSASENCINAVLCAMSDTPGDVVNAYNSHGCTALQLAVLKENSLMVRKLLSRLVNIDADKRSEVIGVGGSNNWGSTALHFAAASAHLPLIQELLDNGAGVDARSECGETALFVAARCGHADVIKLLVGKGADANATCKGRPPLYEAAHLNSGNLEAVECLVKNGALVNPGDGSHPLHGAVFSENAAVVEFLVRSGADVNVKDSVGATPLQHAACLPDSEILKYLISNGADVGARDLKGGTLLHYAVGSEKPENAVFLLDRGAEVDAEDFCGETPLHVAVKCRSFHLVDILLDRGADINARDVRGQTPLHCAVTCRNEEIRFFFWASNVWEKREAGRRNILKVAKLLIEQGADWRSIDEDGETPLHGEVHDMAAKPKELSMLRGDGGWNRHHDGRYRSYAKMIRVLLNRGADENVKNNDGVTPLELARNQSCIDILHENELVIK